MLVVSLDNRANKKVGNGYVRPSERIKITLENGEYILIHAKRDGNKNKIGIDASDETRIEREYMINGVWKTKRNQKK